MVKTERENDDKQVEGSYAAKRARHHDETVSTAGCQATGSSTTGSALSAKTCTKKSCINSEGASSISCGIDSGCDEGYRSDGNDSFMNFDYDAEHYRIRMIRPIFSTEYFAAKTTLKERARKYQYFYKDEETFRLALELLNRRNAKNSDDIYSCHEVRGRHKTPCSECETDFQFGMDYFKECTDSGWAGSAKKLCRGCLGRKMKKTVGANRDEIETALVDLRAEQKGCLFVSGYLGPVSHSQFLAAHLG